jgi:GTP-binding protein Era
LTAPETVGGKAPAFRSGIVAVAGRANVGKSTLVNTIVGQKVSIVSDKPQTTRNAVRGVLSLDEGQLVFVDTPGLHKPRTLLGRQLNRTALGAVTGVDLVVFVIDGKAGLGRGDRFVADEVGARDICVLNKVDGVSRVAVMRQLQALAEWGFEEYFAVSARTGAGVDDLVKALMSRMPEGPALYPDEVAGDKASGTAGETEEQEWVAELVREQLLAITHDELPYSIACRVTEWEWPYVRCEILVERDSQKGIVIGQGGAVLKKVGSAVRAQLPPGAYIELSVRVARDWQQRPEMLKQLGL